MAHQVDWTDTILRTFFSEGRLTAFETRLMTDRVNGISRVEMCFLYHCSMSKIDRTIKGLKRKYDKCRVHHPELPPRRFSQKELEMDGGIDRTWE